MEVDSEQSEYFTSYEDLEVHRLMLEDRPRTEAYKNAIFANKEYFKDKVVMDVGCGTGILSLFCAQAGAKKVYAIEASNLANLAKEIVKENKLEEVIEVIHSRVEEIDLPNNMLIDVIISEWMGFYLFHEGMLDSVLVARDKFLKNEGKMFPETAAVYCAPCSLPSLYKTWDDMYGVSLKSFAKRLRSSKGNKPEILTVQAEDLLSSGEAVCWIDLKESSIEDINSFHTEHIIAAEKNGLYQGICLWFECVFPDTTPEEKGSVTLSTSPRDPPTHWKQTVIVLPQEFEVEHQEPIAFKLDITRDASNCRRYNLELTMLDPDEITHPIGCKCYLLKCILITAYIDNPPEGSNDNHEKTKDDKVVNNGILEEDTIDDDGGDG